MLVWAYDDLGSGAQVNMASALEIMIAPAYLGAGLSSRILAALREAVAAQGITTMVAPLRPNELSRTYGSATASVTHLPHS